MLVEKNNFGCCLEDSQNITRFLFSLYFFLPDPQPDNTSGFQGAPHTRMIPGGSRHGLRSEWEQESLGGGNPSRDDDLTILGESAARTGIQMRQDLCHLHQGDTTSKGPPEKMLAVYLAALPQRCPSVPAPATQRAG